MEMAYICFLTALLYLCQGGYVFHAVSLFVCKRDCETCQIEFHDLGAGV